VSLASKSIESPDSNRDRSAVLGIGGVKKSAQVRASGLVVVERPSAARGSPILRGRRKKSLGAHPEMYNLRIGSDGRKRVSPSWNR